MNNLWVQDWLEDRKVKRLVLILTSVDTQETLERWEFNVEYEEEDGEGKGGVGWGERRELVEFNARGRDNPTNNNGDLSDASGVPLRYFFVVKLSHRSVLPCYGMRGGADRCLGCYLVDTSTILVGKWCFLSCSLHEWRDLLDDSDQLSFSYRTFFFFNNTDRLQQ